MTPVIAKMVLRRRTAWALLNALCRVRTQVEIRTRETQIKTPAPAIIRGAGAV